MSVFAATKWLQSCPALCHPMDCSLPGSSVHSILQAKILEWVAIPFCRGSSQGSNSLTSLMYLVLAGGFFTTSTTWEALCYLATLFSWAPKSVQMATAAMKLKEASSLEEKYKQSRQHIKKQRQHFANKGLSSQSYGFSSSHEWM